MTWHVGYSRLEEKILDWLSEFIIIIIIIIKVFIKNSLRKQTCNNLHEEIMINCN